MGIGFQHAPKGHLGRRGVLIGLGGAVAVSK